MSYVLDSSAVLAYFFDEPGGSSIESIIPSCSMSTVNYSEVVARSSERGYTREHIDLSLAELKLQLVEFDSDQATETGLLRSSTRHLGLSLGDRACLVLARHLGLPALTADRAWADLDIGVEIKLIR